MNHRPKPRAVARTAFVLFLALGLLATPRGPAEAKRWESDKHNVVLEIPDDPFPWEWMPYSKTYEQYNIVKGARRVVDKLRANGKPAQGEGAMLHLVVRDALKDETLQKAAVNPDVKKFILGRFKKHGSIETAETDLIGDVPALLLSVDGEAKNLAGNVSPCHSLTVVAVLRKKVYLLRMYAWHTEFDEEGLKGDLDFIAADGLSFQVTTSLEEPKGPGGAGGPPIENDPDEPEEDEIIWFVGEPMRMVRDGLLRRKEMTKREKHNYLILKLEGNSQRGSHQLFMYAIPNNRVVDGVAAGQENIKKGITTTWYKQFLASHPTGDIFRFKWPRKAAFLSIPELVDDNRTVLFDGKKKKRVLRPSATEIIKKLGIVEKAKKPKIGDHKPSEAYRGNLQGLQGGVGKVTTFRFAFRGRHHSFRVYVTFARDGFMQYGKAMNKTLGSIEFFKKPPKTMKKEIADQEAKNAEKAAKDEAEAKKRAEAEAKKAAEEAERAGEAGGAGEADDGESGGDK